VSGSRRQDAILINLKWELKNEEVQIKGTANPSNQAGKGVPMKKLLTKLERGEQVTIVALGDSNTELTFHTRGYLNWVCLLHEALFEKYGPTVS